MARWHRRAPIHSIIACAAVLIVPECPSDPVDLDEGSELVIVHEGPGLCQPDGVAPGVSHLLAPCEPEMYGFSVIPGEKRLLL